MSLSIRSSRVSDHVLGNLSRTRVERVDLMGKMASGLRVRRAADDAAGISLAARMGARIRSYNQASRNVLDGISACQVAQSALQEQANMVTRLRELAMQAANGTLGGEQRDYLDAEKAHLLDEITRIANVTRFNGVQLLNVRAPHDPEALDVDADGDRDALVTSDSGGTVTLLRNDGAGGKTEEVVAQGVSPMGVVSADIDGDGSPDALVTDQGADQVMVLRNDGTGSFSSSTVGVDSQPTRITTGDIDADGDPDGLVVAEGADALNVLRNDGDGNFSSSTVSLPSTPRDVATADLDVDGDVDVVVAMENDDAVLKLSNDSMGNFTRSSVAVGDAPTRVLTGDVNGDFLPDVVVSNSGDDTVSVLVNDGAGGFTRSNLATGDQPVGMTLGDLDIDGDQDLVVANVGDDTASIFHNDGDGNFTLTQTLSLSATPGEVALQDTDADGKMDVVVTHPSGNGISVLAQGASSFSVTTDTGPSGSRDITSIREASTAQSLDIQSGVDAHRLAQVTIQLADTTSDALGLEGLDMTDADSARACLARVDDALTQISSMQARFAYSHHRLGVASSINGTSAESSMQSRSRVVDLDVAQAASQMAAASVREQAGFSLLAQSQTSKELLLKLIQG